MTRFASSARLHAAAGVVAVAVALPMAARPVVAAVRIHEIQGKTRLSPLDGKPVTDVPGIVTAVRDFGPARGFWFQDPQSDDDPATSEGIFVSTRSAPTVAVGDAVQVDGTVREFYPPRADPGAESLTEIAGPTIRVISKGNPVPAPVVLRGDDIPDAYAPPSPAPGQSIESLPLQPKRYALDLFESLEGMAVEVDDARVVGPTDKYHALWVTAKPRQNPTPRGGTLYAGYDQPNSGRLQVQTLIPFREQAFPAANVGDQLVGPTAGPLDYSPYGGYTIEATRMGTLKVGGIQPTTTRRPHGDELALATYNVENLAPSDPAAKYARLAGAVLTNLGTPDIVALEEIQDNSGKKDDGVVAADRTMAKFVDAIRKAGGPAYDWRSIDPQNDADGGQPGGNIRQVLLFNPARVAFTEIPGGTATSAVGVATGSGGVRLTASPGRIAPADPAWQKSRKPLAAQFSFHGKTVFVIANHFDAKLGDQTLDSRFQPPQRASEVQRVAQARVERAFVAQLLAADPRAELVVLGDLNDFPFSPAVHELQGDGLLHDMFDTLPADERYSYVYDGNSQAIDHILISPAARRAEYAVVHVNAEFADQSSDHDPQVLRFEP